MAKVKITGHASGSGVFTITAPNSNTDRTITLPDASVTLGTDATKLPLAGGALTGAVTTNSTFDGRDVAADGVLATNALPKGGGTMTGDIKLNDSVKAKFGTGNDLQIYHDGSNAYIDDDGDGDLDIRSNGSKISLKRKADGHEGLVYTLGGSIKLKHNNNIKIETTAAGCNVSGDLVSILPAGSSREHIVFKNGSSVKGSIVSSDYTNNTSYNTTSDYRLKENVVDMENATDRLKQLQPRRFNFTANPDLTMDGFIAHEITPVVPEAVTGEKDAVDSNSNPQYQGIDQSKLVPLLVKTIQELEARITALEA